MESIVHPNDDFLGAPELDYDGFRAALREDWGWFSPAQEANIFASKVRTRRVCGFVAMDLTSNATRVERTMLDIRRDDMNYYYVTFHATGESTIIHDDRVINVAAGDVVLLDSTRPVTFVPAAQHRDAQWVALQLPRQNLVSHLGFEPQGIACGHRQAQAAVCFVNSLLTPSAMQNWSSRRLINLCVWWFMISSGRCLRRPHRLAHATTTSCSYASAASSRTDRPPLSGPIGMLV